METLTRGRTVGKMALGLRVVRDDGGPITFRQALVRGVIGLALERPGVFLLSLGPPIGMMTAMFSKRCKRIGDMAAGTVVLQERQPRRPVWTPVMPPPLAGWAPTLDLARVDDALALYAREFLGRAGELRPAARETLAAELVDEVRMRTTPGPPQGTPGWAYLSAVLAERRRREEDRASRAAGGPGLPPGWYPGWPPPVVRGYAGGPGTYARPPYAGPSYAGGAGNQAGGGATYPGPPYAGDPGSQGGPPQQPPYPGPPQPPYGGGVG
jgi:hypothetical protein